MLVEVTSGHGTEVVRSRFMGLMPEASIVAEPVAAAQLLFQCTRDDADAGRIARSIMPVRRS